MTRKRGRLTAPGHLVDHVSRADAAVLLGFASEFKIRQMERAGVLKAERGVMGSAWYPRAAVLALRGGGGDPPGWRGRDRDRHARVLRLTAPGTAAAPVVA